MAASGSAPPSNPPSEFSIPDAFLQPAKCLIILTGLDTRNNAVHMAVWDLFMSGGRGDRKPVKYDRVTADHIYPKEASSPETEEPMLAAANGILKQEWIHKHSNELPAVVVFFYDLDWDHPQWSEKVTECASKVQVIRSSLESHSTELCVALIQSVRPTPSGSDPTISEKANEICRACELPGPNLYVMPYVDRPEGFVNRLETSFYDMALRYYGNRARKIRVTKDLTSRPQQLLSIRRQFKVAYFMELKQDHKEALKLYSNCYKYLIECMWLSEDRIMEFKMVAGFLNYKICQFMFDYEDPRSSLGQFQRHLDLFRTDKGPDSLVFQHTEWIANQFIAFGDLFAEAVRKHLRPTQIAHPGLYYYEAVQYLLETRRLQQKICKASYLAMPRPFPVLSAIEFVGQRPWRVGLSDSQPSSSELREKAIKILQAREYSVDYSYQICLLLSKALDHFKLVQHKTDNMINHLTVLLGEEYLITKEYVKSLALLEWAVSDYREHRWWTVLTHLLQIMLKCSHVLGNVKSYVSIVLELISRFLPLDIEEKKRLHSNLNLILKGHPPNPEVKADQSENESIQDVWFGNLAAVIAANIGDNTIYMSSLASCVECKIVFSENSYSSDSIIHLNIYLRSSAPLTLSFSKVQLLFDNEVYNRWCVTDGNITLESEKIIVLEYYFPAFSETLQVISLEAIMGPYKLVWSGEMIGKNKEGLSPRDWHWNKIKNRTSTLVLQRDPKVQLQLDHSPPILLAEYYPVTVRVKNQEITEIKNIQISAIFLLEQHKSKINEEVDPPIQLYTSLPSSSLSASASYSVQLSCDSLKPQDESMQVFYIKSCSIGTQKISVSLSYCVDCVVRKDWDPVECLCEKEEMLTLETVTPVRVSHRIMNMRFQPVDVVFYHEPFILQSSLHSLAPSPLTLSCTKCCWNQSVVPVSQFLPNAVNGSTLLQQDIITELHCIQVLSPSSVSSSSSPPSDIQLTLGSYHYQWKRENEDSSQAETTKKVPLPQVTVKHLPYTITVDMLSYATLHELIPVTFSINNKTIFVQEFEAHLAINSNDFTCSGNKLSRFRILPLSSYELSYNLFPLNVGHVTLPRLEVTCISQPKLDERVLQGTVAGLPLSLYVMPQSLERLSSPHTGSVCSSLTPSVTASI